MTESISLAIPVINCALTSAIIQLNNMKKCELIRVRKSNTSTPSHFKRKNIHYKMNNKLDIESHMRSFAETFVLPGRRDKWIRLLCERPDTILSQSSKLFNYLNHNDIEQNDSLNDVSPDDTMGVFYNFIDEPNCISFAKAVKEAKGQDAIFSIQPGKLAVYFLLDGWKFVCRK